MTWRPKNHLTWSALKSLDAQIAVHYLLIPWSFANNWQVKAVNDVQYLRKLLFGLMWLIVGFFCRWMLKLGEELRHGWPSCTHTTPTRSQRRPVRPEASHTWWLPWTACGEAYDRRDGAADVCDISIKHEPPRTHAHMKMVAVLSLVWSWHWRWDPASKNWPWMVSMVPPARGPCCGVKSSSLGSCEM